MLEDNYLLMLAKSIGALAIIISMYLVAMFLIKQRKINFFNTRRNSNLHIIDFTILPNKSQIITLKAKGFNKSYLFVLQTNGETKLIDSKYVE